MSPIVYLVYLSPVKRNSRGVLVSLPPVFLFTCHDLQMGRHPKRKDMIKLPFSGGASPIDAHRWLVEPQACARSNVIQPVRLPCGDLPQGGSRAAKHTIQRAAKRLQVS